MVEKLSETELYSTITTILRKVMYRPESLGHVTPDTRMEDLEIDSARLVDLVLHVEDEFGIQIDDDAIEGIKTIGDLVTLIRTKAS
jgi:acyl carrier protein